MVNRCTMDFHILSKLPLIACYVIHLGWFQKNCGKSFLLPIVCKSKCCLPESAAGSVAEVNTTISPTHGAIRYVRALRPKCSVDHGSTWLHPLVVPARRVWLCCQWHCLQRRNPHEHTAPYINLTRVAMAHRSFDHAEDHLQSRSILNCEQFPQGCAHDRFLPNRQRRPHHDSCIEDIPLVCCNLRDWTIFIPGGNVGAVSEGLLQSQQQ
mmetsp:Transcript_13434/g.37170  ORF Transcript_13434/g.37170 Transcript_13434/m.37170 type:complete len:210 (-) Transcript_13434:448-1077(-)